MADSTEMQNAFYEGWSWAVGANAHPGDMQRVWAEAAERYGEGSAWQLLGGKLDHVAQRLKDLEAENVALKAQIERLKAPVSDAEFAYIYDAQPPLRVLVNEMLAARASVKDTQ